MRDDDTAGQHLCSREQCNNPTSDTLCDPCTRATAKALRELPEIYTRLHVGLEPGAGVIDAPITGSREAPTPLRIGHSAAMTDMTGTLEDWEDAVRDNEQYTPRPPRGREGVRLQGAAAFLVQHLDQLVHHPAGVVACDEIRALRSRALRRLDLTNPVDRLPAPCPDCEHLGLVRHNGASM